MPKPILTTAALTVLAGVIVFAIYTVLFGSALFHRPGERAINPGQAQENVFVNAPTKTLEGSVPVTDPNYTEEYKVAHTDSYEIVYQKLYDIYIIALLKRPIEETRKEAEREFLRIANADLAVACSLQVKVVVPAYVDPAYAGQEMPLSGC